MSIQATLDNVSYLRILAFGCAFAILYTFSTAIYRLYFHPLAKYPGPLLARLTAFPSFWHTLHGDRHIWLLDLQEKYGSTFRYRPDAILINTPTAYRTIYGPKGNVKKSKAYNAWPRTVDTLNTWNCTSIPIHTQKRRILNHALSDKAVRSAQDFVISNTDRWCDLIAQEIPEGGWSRSLNMADWANHLVFDILGDLCFGKNFNMKEPDSDLRYVPHLMSDYVKLMHPIAYSPFVDVWIWLKPRGLDWLINKVPPPALKKWMPFVEQCLAERSAAEEAVQKSKAEADIRKDFFYYIFNTVDPETGKGFSREELFAESDLLIIAGSDTTSTVMAAMFFYLSRNPAVQARLAKEILSAFSSSADIKAGPQLQSCKYLWAFIHETLRMSPPVPAELMREVLPGGTTIDGEFLPPGVHASTGLYCLSYNKDVYHEPFRFRPERWLATEEGSTPESVALAEKGSCAFSTGTRGCVGKNLAWLEMQTVMAKLIYLFEMKPDPKNNLGAGDPNAKAGRRDVDQYQLWDAFVSVRDGPMTQFKKRQVS